MSTNLEFPGSAGDEESGLMIPVQGVRAPRQGMRTSSNKDATPIIIVGRGNLSATSQKLSSANVVIIIAVGKVSGGGGLT